MWLDFFPNGWARYAGGGLLIGLGVALLFVMTGRLGGASTVFSSTWSWLARGAFFQQAAFLQNRHWRVLYALGMLLGGVLYVAMGLPLESSDISLGRLVIGGLLIGFGARLGGVARRGMAFAVWLRSRVVRW